MLLLERDKQLALLGRWHEATATRGGCVALVTGEAGIGGRCVTSAVRWAVRFWMQ
jgi:predicted ATPase